MSDLADDPVVASNLDRMADASRAAQRKFPGNERQASQEFLRDYIGGPGDPRFATRTGMPLSEYLSQQEAGPVQEPRRAYAAAVNDSLDRPVISVRFARDRFGVDAIASENYPSGYLTPRQYMEEKAADAVRKYITTPGIQKQMGDERLRQFHIQQALGLRDKVLANAEDVEGMLAGTMGTDANDVKELMREVTAAVNIHAPGNEYAKFAARPEEENQQAQQQYGPEAKFVLNADGRQNYEAQRLLDLWSANDDNYAPASTMSQVQRAVGGFVSPIYGMMTGKASGYDRYGIPTGLPRNAGEEWDEMALMSRPDGKYQYAAEVYGRSANDNPEAASVYTPEGRPKYEAVNPTSPMGLANMTTMNADFPLANAYQSNTKRVLEIPSTIGNALGGGDENQAQNLAELRNRVYRTTPVAPAGASMDEFRRVAQQLDSADKRLAGYNSAQLGPKFADLYNATPLATFTGKAQREFLSPAMQTLLEVPAESITDPINVAFNAAFPIAGAVRGAIGAGRAGLGAMAKQGGADLIRGLSKSLKRMGGDAVDEQVESAGIGSAFTGLGNYITPERHTLLMPGVEATDPQLNEKVQVAAEQANMDKQEAAAAYGRMINRKPMRDPLAR